MFYYILGAEALVFSVTCPVPGILLFMYSRLWCIFGLWQKVPRENSIGKGPSLNKKLSVGKDLASDYVLDGSPFCFWNNPTVHYFPDNIDSHPRPPSNLPPMTVVYPCSHEDKIFVNVFLSSVCQVNLGMFKYQIWFDWLLLIMEWRNTFLLTEVMSEANKRWDS